MSRYAIKTKQGYVSSIEYYYDKNKKWCYEIFVNDDINNAKTWAYESLKRAKKKFENIEFEIVDIKNNGK